MEERDTQLSQAYRDASHPELSSDLDARILDAARQAVAKPAAKPAVRRRPTWFTWAVPFTTVAVVVLGVTLLFEMQKQAPEMLESPTAMPPTVSLEKAETPSAPESTSDEAGAQQSRDIVAKPASPVTDSTRAQAKASPKQSVPEPAIVDSAEPMMETPSPQPFPALPAVVPAPPSPPPVARTAPMPVPPTARSDNGAGGSLADQASEAMSMPPPTAMESINGRVPALGAAQATRKADQSIETPEQMVGTIRRLIRENRLDEARKVLDELRRTNPGFDVPEDLRVLYVR